MLGRLDDVSASCPCGQKARRNQVNRISVGTKEKKYRVSDVVEASQEIDHAYTRAEAYGAPVRRANLWKMGLAEAKRRGAKLRGGD